jgi:ribonuclease P protein component
VPDQDRGAVGEPERLKLRRDFLAAAKGGRAKARAFSLQGVAATGRETESPRFGFTATKKIGGSTERNRIRRRLREAVRLMPDSPARRGHDYVILAKREALYADFRELADDLRLAILRLHTEPRSARRDPSTKAAKAEAAAKERPGARKQNQAIGS